MLEAERWEVAAEGCFVSADDLKNKCRDVVRTSIRMADRKVAMIVRLPRPIVDFRLTRNEAAELVRGISVADDTLGGTTDLST